MHCKDVGVVLMERPAGSLGRFFGLKKILRKAL
jgi:hypothetical protein